MKVHDMEVVEVYNAYFSKSYSAFAKYLNNGRLVCFKWFTSFDSSMQSIKSANFGNSISILMANFKEKFNFILTKQSFQLSTKSNRHKSFSIQYHSIVVDQFAQNISKTTSEYFLSRQQFNNGKRRWVKTQKELFR